MALNFTEKARIFASSTDEAITQTQNNINYVLYKNPSLHFAERIPKITNRYMRVTLETDRAIVLNANTSNRNQSVQMHHSLPVIIQSA